MNHLFSFDNNKMNPPPIDIHKLRQGCDYFSYYPYYLPSSYCDGKCDSNDHIGCPQFSDTNLIHSPNNNSPNNNPNNTIEHFQGDNQKMILILTLLIIIVLIWNKI